MKTSFLKRFKTVQDEAGVALITALLLMAVLSILAVTAYLTTSNELKITRNYQTAKTAFYSTEGAIGEVKARLKGVPASGSVPASPNYAGDPNTTPDTTWSAYIVTDDLVADGWQITDDANYDGDYTNFIPIPTIPAPTGAGNSIQTEMSYWVKVRHKRECDPVLAGQISSGSGIKHYIDNDNNEPIMSDCENDPVNKGGDIIFYGYIDEDAPAQTEFTTSLANPPRARPVEIVRGYGFFQGSKKIIETELKRNMGPNIDSALYADTVTGNGTVEVHGEDNCQPGTGVTPVKYTTSSNWDPYATAPGSVDLVPLTGDPEIEPTPDKDILAMIKDLMGDADREIFSDKTNYSIGSENNYETVYINTATFNPDSQVDFNNLTGYGTLLIEGDVEFKAKLKWYGVILVSGTVDFVGSGPSDDKNVYGAVLADSLADMHGNAIIKYDSCEIKNALSKGSVTSLRWRDRDLD